MEKKGTFSIIFKIIKWIVGSILVLILSMVVLSSWNLIDFFKPYVITSGSMEPAISTGDIAIVSYRDSYEKDDIITFIMPSNPSTVVTHRVIETLGSAGQRSYRTKGDANAAEDIDIVQKVHIVGKVILTIPYLGYAVNFAKTQMGFMLLVIVPAVLIIYNEILNIKEAVKKE